MNRRRMKVMMKMKNTKRRMRKRVTLQQIISARTVTMMKQI